MNLAYLVMAHHQPKQLRRLISRLSAPRVYFFIHIDRRKDLAPFEHELRDLPRVAFVRKRVALNWVSWSVVESMVAALREAFGTGIGFKYYVTLSGADYPIRSQAYLQDFFERHDENFVTLHGEVYPTVVPGFTERYTRYHFMNVPALNPRGPYPVHPVFRRVRTLLERYPIRRRLPADLRLHQGSAWTGLTEPFVAYLLDQFRRPSQFRRLFNHFYAPDEVFFQWMIKNSPFASTIYYDCETDTRDKNWLGLHYINWHTPDVVLPKTLDDGDFEALHAAHPHALFARKFDETASARLLDRIDAELLAPGPLVS